MLIQGYEVDVITETLECIIDYYNAVIRKDGPDAGYFTIRDSISGQPLQPIPIGVCPDDRVEKCFRLSLEKGERLFINKTHVSSFQSRDIANKKYGGAITFPNLIISFSGLPELVDEAVMLVLAYKLGWMDWAGVQNIITISQNPFFEKFAEIYQSPNRN